MTHKLWTILPLLALAACGGEPPASEKGDGVDVNITAKDEDGSTVSVSSASSSSVSIDSNGVSIKADMSGLDSAMSNSDFDIDGVKLYPGAKITSVNITADSSKPDGQQGQVAFGMTAPAAPGVVLAWYAKAFAAKGITTTVKGSNLSGLTKDGDAFAIELAPEGSGSKGKVRISG